MEEKDQYQSITIWDSLALNFRNHKDKIIALRGPWNGETMIPKLFETFAELDIVLVNVNPLSKVKG